MKTITLEALTDEIIARLEKGVVPWRKPWVSRRPRNLITKRLYRGYNIFLLGLKGREQPYWCTRKAAESKGGRIKESEKKNPAAVFVWLPATVKKTALPDGVMVRRYPRTYLCHELYNVEQTEGLERFVPETPRREFLPVEKAEEIVRGMPHKPRVGYDGCGAFYSPIRDEIRMPARRDFESSEEYYSTLFHEFVHATGHESRLSRQSLTRASRFGDHSYSFEELVAEMGAALLCGEAGISPQTVDNSAAYIGGWLKKLEDNRLLLLQAAALGHKAFDFVTGGNPTREDHEQENDRRDHSAGPLPRVPPRPGRRGRRGNDRRIQGARIFRGRHRHDRRRPLRPEGGAMDRRHIHGPLSGGEPPREAGLRP